MKDPTNDRVPPDPLARDSIGVCAVGHDHALHGHLPEPDRRAIPHPASVAFTLAYYDAIALANRAVSIAAREYASTSGAGTDPQTGTTADSDRDLRDAEADLSDAFAVSLAEAHGYTDPDAHPNAHTNSMRGESGQPGPMSR